MTAALLAATVTAATLTAAQDTSRLTLHGAVERALAQYPSLAVSRAARERARAELGEARSTRLPRLVLDGSANRFQEPMLVYPLHGFPTGLPAAGSAGPAFDRTLLQGSAFLSWTLFDFGQRGARVRASRLFSGAADAALGASELQLIQRAAAAYLRVLTARQTLAAQDQRLAALTAESERVGRLLAEGKAARVERLRVDAERARSAAERIATAAQLDVAEHDLAQLVGAPYETLSRADLAPVALAQAGATEAERATLIERAREASPELEESRRRAAAARAAGDAARATRFPELRLATGLVDRGRGSGDFQAEWQAGLSLSYAAWTGGSRSSQIQRAEAESRLAAEQTRLAELNLALGVDRALAAVREAHARVEALRTAALQSEEVARIERTALEVGSGTQTDYLEAESNLLRTRASLIEAGHAEIAARIELARVTGELSPAWLARTLNLP